MENVKDANENAHPVKTETTNPKEAIHRCPHVHDPTQDPVTTPEIPDVD